MCITFLSPCKGGQRGHPVALRFQARSRPSQRGYCHMFAQQTHEAQRLHEPAQRRALALGLAAHGSEAAPPTRS